MPKISPKPHEANGRSSPSPGGKEDEQVGALILQPKHVVARVCRLLEKYIILPPTSILVVALWIIAAYLVACFDRFPHLGVTSPTKRCAKTRLLRLIEAVAANPYNVANLTAATIFRLITREKTLTILLDEAQSLSRRGSESSEVVRELFCAGIDRNAKVLRCGGRNFENVHEFSIYCGKVIAAIGDLDGVLADRCLPIRLERKTRDQKVERLYERELTRQTTKLRGDLQKWATEHADEIAALYEKLTPIDTENDRLAELMLPLQAVLGVVDEDLVPVLEAYVREISQQEADHRGAGEQLLAACREVFGKEEYIRTQELLQALYQRDDEPWADWSNGRPLSSTALAGLLRPFGIRPEKRQEKIAGINHQERGYRIQPFREVWARYIGISK